jgi:hypothetical protein
MQKKAKSSFNQKPLQADQMAKHNNFIKQKKRVNAITNVIFATKLVYYEANAISALYGLFFGSCAWSILFNSQCPFTQRL